MNLTSREKENLLHIVSKHLERCNEILFAYIHGSFTGEGPFRDLDLAVFLSPGFLPQAGFRYEMQLESWIEESIDRVVAVDVRILNTAPLRFRYHALRGRLVLDRDPDVRVSFTRHTVSRYLDIAPILKHHTREAFAIESGS